MPSAKAEKHGSHLEPLLRPVLICQVTLVCIRHHVSVCLGTGWGRQEGIKEMKDVAVYPFRSDKDTLYQTAPVDIFFEEKVFQHLLFFISWGHPSPDTCDFTPVTTFGHIVL